MTREALKDAIAKGEAEGAEPDAPDDEGEGEGEGDEADAAYLAESADVSEQPAAVRDDKDVEKLFRALGKEDARHAGAVVRIVGPDAGELTPCPLCAASTAGFLFPGSAEGAPPEVKDAVRRAIGDQPVPEYRTAKDAIPCDDCAGWGVVLTGSKAPGQITKACSTCNGQGWKPDVKPPEPVTFGPFASANAGVPGSNGSPDAWGRSLGHPHYGRHPAEIGV